MKRGMSPLLSTLMLMGFAIALGGVVMSWGKAGFTTERPLDCTQTRIEAVSYGSNKGVCSKGEALELTIQNNGEIDIDGVKVSLLGENNIYSWTISNKVMVADIAKLDLQHPDIGKINKVVVIPKFVYNDNERLCPNNGFSIEDIGEC